MCASACRIGSYGLVRVSLIVSPSIGRIAEALDPGRKNGQNRHEFRSIIAPIADAPRVEAAGELVRGGRDHRAPSGSLGESLQPARPRNADVAADASRLRIDIGDQ